MHQEPTNEHVWLKQLVGEWTFESECNMGPDQPPVKTPGTEVVRMFGDLWVIAECVGGTAEDSWKSIMTIGFDPRTNRFVGTFVVTMASHLWVYNGALDPSSKLLFLDTEGPNFTDGKIIKYQDTIEILSPTERTLSSKMMGGDGKWIQFMKARYRRK
ncbi:MAG: DUF1579 domain-containing protein [Planctomycetes bacterium]|nr:DUF1579 domain-containing protein [Planctomycetota bacterium]